MAPAIRSHQTGSATTGSGHRSPGVTLSGSAVAGDLGVLFVSSDRCNPTAFATYPAPTGWTEQVAVEQGGFNNIAKMFTAPVAATGTFSVTYTTAANSTTDNVFVATLCVCSDAVLDEALGNADDVGPSVTADEAGELLIVHTQFGDPRAGATAPSGMTALPNSYATDANNLTASQTWYQTNVGPGATGTKTPGNVAATTGTAISALFKAAAAPPRTNAFFPFFGV